MLSLRRLRAQPLVQLVVYLVVLYPLLLPILAVVKGLVAAVPGVPLLAWQIVAYAIGDACLVIVLLLGLRFLERRTAPEAGLGRNHAVRHLLLGFAGGAAVMTAIVGVLAAAGWYRLGPGDNPDAVLPVGALYLLAAFSEEVRFRAIVFRLAEQGLGTWLAVAGSALIFGLAHATAPHATPAGTLAVALGGVLGALVFVLARSLWPVIGLHWAWNTVQGGVFGAAVSGQGALPSLVHPNVMGPAAWTGGAFGPEAGLVAVIVTGAVGAALLALAVRRGRVITPDWLRRLAPGRGPLIDRTHSFR